MEIFSLEKGQKVIKTLQSIFEQKNQCGVFFAIGALSRLTIKVYDLEEKKYSSKTFDGKYEVCNMTGILARLDGKIALHPHISVSDSNFNVIGGHLEEAIVGATLEVIFFAGDDIERKYSDQIGLNLLKK